MEIGNIMFRKKSTKVLLQTTHHNELCNSRHFVLWHSVNQIGTESQSVYISLLDSHPLWTTNRNNKLDLLNLRKYSKRLKVDLLASGARTRGGVPKLH